MTYNHNKYKCFNYWNNGQGAYVFHWKDGHKEWKNKQVKKPSVCFSNPDTNEVIYYYYLITTSEEFTEEEAKDGDDSNNNDFIYLSRFELLKLLIKRVFSTLLLYIYFFMM